MLKITDLFDSKNFVELQESEMENIHGGNCEYGGGSYSAGIELKIGGNTYLCEDRRFRGDTWKLISTT